MKFTFIIVAMIVLASTMGLAQQSGQTVKWGEQVEWGKLISSDSTQVFALTDSLNGADTLYTGAINFDAIDGVTKFVFVAEPISSTVDSLNVDFRLGHIFEAQVNGDNTRYVEFEAWKNVHSNVSGNTLDTWRFNVADSATYSPSDLIQFRVRNIDSDSALVFEKLYCK
jgi:hypothetical protein